MKDHPQFNSFINGHRLIMLEDLTISVLIEKEINGKKVPEPIGISRAQIRTFEQINTKSEKLKNNQRINLAAFRVYSVYV
jgi:hypothetical protein